MLEIESAVLCLHPEASHRPSHLPQRRRLAGALAWLTRGLGSVALLAATVSCSAESARESPVTYSYRVVKTYPHDPAAFTQGLVFLKGVLLEGTGLYGQSSLRRVELPTGHVTQQVSLPSPIFGEGIAVLGAKIYQLSWQNHKGFVYDLQTFALEREFAYEGEGWGLTTDGQSLILSDGTESIRFLDPTTFAVTRTIRVLNQGTPIKNLNELEFIKGEIFANIWQSNWIARIDPADGRLKGVINLSHLLKPEEIQPETDVLNGIAYDPDGDRLFVTGKRWPKLFEIQLTEPKAP
jgi:glutamine cyclotransferase